MVCAHGAFKIPKQLVNRVCSFTHSASHHPFTPPPVVPTPHRPFPGPLAFVAPQHPRRRPRRGAAPPWRRGPIARHLVLRCPHLRRRRARRRQRLEAPPRGSPPPTPTLAVGETRNLRSEVREFHLFQNCVASWLNGSHYLLLVFVKITKTTN